MKAIGRSFVGISLAGLLFAAGCGVLQGKSKDAVTTRSGIPSARWQVGGGFDIAYTAPLDGVVYVVDQNSGRFLITESVSEGDDFSFEVYTDQDFAALGIDPSSAKIGLYFVPSTVFYPAPPQTEE